MHLEVLDEERKKMFPYLRYFKKFYLAGGTALALQIGHRTSVDFDLFIQKEIPSGLLGKIKEVFPKATVQPLVNNKGELTVLVHNVKCTFFNSVFASVLPLVKYEQVPMASVREIAADKAHTIGRRGKYRDYVDLYFILKEEHIPLDEIIQLAEKKYGGEFNGRLFLEQLIYLEDIADDPISFVKKATSKGDMQSFFEKEIKKIKL